jgi:hypothetical protein
VIGIYRQQLVEDRRTGHQPLASSLGLFRKVSEVDHSLKQFIRYSSLFLKLEIHSAVSTRKSDLRTIHGEENNE